MTRIKIIQIQGSVKESIKKITSDVRNAVSHVCLGVDDMQLLGNKALVIKAEVFPDDLQALYTSLASIGVKLNQQSLPDRETLQDEVEYPILMQITSFSDDTDSRISIPNVPG
jgi:hypothetical protein